MGLGHDHIGVDQRVQAEQRQGREGVAGVEVQAPDGRALAVVVGGDLVEHQGGDLERLGQPEGRQGGQRQLDGHGEVGRDQARQGQVLAEEANPVHGRPRALEAGTACRGVGPDQTDLHGRPDSRDLQQHDVGHLGGGRGGAGVSVCSRVELDGPDVGERGQGNRQQGRCVHRGPSGRRLRLDRGKAVDRDDVEADQVHVGGDAACVRAGRGRASRQRRRGHHRPDHEHDEKGGGKAGQHCLTRSVDVGGVRGGPPPPRRSPRDRQVVRCS